MALTTVEAQTRRKRSDLVVDEIKAWIVNRRMRPGDKLPNERELIDRFNVGRGTVREALKSLETFGLVERIRGAGGGARVSSMGHDQASQLLRSFFYFEGLTWGELYELRRLVEPELAASVIDRLTADDYAALNRTLDTCRQGAAGDVDARTHRRAELAFHEVLAARCPNPLMRFVCRFMDELLRDFVVADDVLQTDGGRFARCTLTAHEELLAAFRAGDADAVRERMRAHIDEAGCIITEQEAKRESCLLL